MQHDKFLISILTTSILFGSSVVCSAEKFITLAATTSTENSGLFDQLLPLFTAQSNIAVRVVAVGTGKAIKMAQTGDADVLLVHHRASEQKFIEAGFGVERFDLMYNHFVLIGPDNDPAMVKKSNNAVDAFNKILATKSNFVSRGDDSGTHKKELSIWQAANVPESALSGAWYRETGNGMGATLNVAAGIGAYVLTDRGTWLKFGNKAGLALVYQGDQRLFNQYSVILVNPTLHPHIKVAESAMFIDWLLSTQGQAAINDYRIDGRQGFFGNAK